MIILSALISFPASLRYSLSRRRDELPLALHTTQHQQAGEVGSKHPPENDKERAFLFLVGEYKTTCKCSAICPFQATNGQTLHLQKATTENNHLSFRLLSCKLTKKDKGTLKLQENNDRKQLSV